jgi:beta-N-acetylhexosaminidase
MYRRRFVCVFTLVALLMALPQTYQAADDTDRIAQLLANMTLEQRVGQLFMVSLYGANLNDSSRKFLREMAPGAVAAFTSNGTDPQTITATINAWQSTALEVAPNIPLIIAIDHEGGTVTRLKEGFTALPWGPALGAMPADAAGQVGAMAAAELRAVGITMNLAPVADIRAAGDAPTFMEKRAFSPDPELVGSAVAGYIKGLQGGGVIGTLKHFPGHGAATDSHIDLPLLTHTPDEINAIELAPFRAGIAAGADVVMMAHLHIPALDNTPGLPASLSRPIITGLLRETLGYQGVIMTDAMDMGAIVKNFTPPKSAVMAVQAGIDMIATGPHMPLSQQLEMKKAIVAAVRDGQIPAEQIDASVRRILQLKQKYGLLEWQMLDPNAANRRVGMAEHTAQLERLYAEAVAVGFDFSGLLPLDAAKQKIAIVYPGIYPAIARACGAVAKPDSTLGFSTKPTPAEINAVSQTAKRADIVVVFTYNVYENAGQADLVNVIPPEKAVVVALQSPYDFEWGISPSTYLTLFNPVPQAFQAACNVLYGKQPVKGVFPAISG